MGAILAGGAASRFGGRAKGLARVGGRRVIDRVYATLCHAGARPIVVSGRAHADAWLPGVLTVADARPGCGSLGGVHTALAVTAGLGAVGVYVVAWDMPFVSAAALVRLRDAARDGMAAIPVHPDGRSEPLCAWYTVGCLTTAARLLETGERRAGALADQVGAVRVPVARLSDAPRLFVNINTPDDLVRARRRDRGTPRPAILA